MSDTVSMKIIARVRSDFATKFGIPRQSGLVNALRATIVFEPEYRNADALRGLEGFSHLWLLWNFSESAREDWSPTVRPPRLGGNVRMGVFATRSPFRPNPLGLSCVKLLGVDPDTEDGPVIHIGGADLMDGTPIFDIKPYIPSNDSHPEALGGFTDTHTMPTLRVDMADEWRCKVPADRLEALLGVLACDPRPSYQKDPERVYGMVFAGLEVRFSVADEVLTVVEVR